MKKNNKLKKNESSPLKKLHEKTEINTDSTTSGSSKKINKQKNNGEATDISDQEDEGKAEFYTFIDKDVWF